MSYISVKSSLHFIVAVVASLFFFSLVYQKLSISSILELFSKLHPNQIFVSIALFYTSQFARGYRWHLISKSYQEVPDVEKNFINFLFGNALNIILPLRGGDIFRVYLASKSMGYFLSTISIIKEKAFDLLLVLYLFASCYLIITNFNGQFIYFFALISIVLPFLILLFSLRAVNKCLLIIPRLRKYIFQEDLIRLAKIYILTVFGYLVDSTIILLLLSGITDFEFLVAIQLNSVLALTSVIPSLPFGFGVFHFFVGSYLAFLDSSIDGFNLSTLLNIFFIFVFCGQMVSVGAYILIKIFRKSVTF